MTFEDRVKVVAAFGVTERQARFLVTVMLHAGVCVPRQYARFAGIAYGHTVSRFFDRLVQRGYARASECLHNRAQLYHVHQHALYRAIGQRDSRFRRPVSGRLVMDRLMVLDAMLTTPDVVWLGTEDERVAFFSLMAPTLGRERLPHITIGAGPAARLRLFPEQLPIGVEKTGRVVFVYLVTAPVAHLRGFVQRHGDLLRALPGWRLRLVLPQPLPALTASLEAVVRDELTTRFSPDTLTELAWYFGRCRATADPGTRARQDERFWLARRRFSTPRCQELYRRWLTDGDTVFEGLSSTVIAEAVARGSARIESQVLPQSYRHLSPLVAVRFQTREGVEEGDITVARPQPLPLPASADVDELTRDWYRLVAARKTAVATSS